MAIILHYLKSCTLIYVYDNNNIRTQSDKRIPQEFFFIVSIIFSLHCMEKYVITVLFNKIEYCVKDETKVLYAYTILNITYKLRI